MGYDMKESRRGLRFSGGDVAAAVDFIQEQRAKQQVGGARETRYLLRTPFQPGFEVHANPFTCSYPLRASSVFIIHIFPHSAMPGA